MSPKFPYAIKNPKLASIYLVIIKKFGHNTVANTYPILLGDGSSQKCFYFGI